mmetsp:Transcript_22569/g.36802  ORF Transcript_22569/g.36802 Transcript_22569/m.36802 type:complete len:271 (+) Transcript_22569:1480-2292(+)
MKEIIDLLCQPLRHTIHRLEVRQIGPRHRLGRAEMRQERPLARRTHARDVIERIGHVGFGPFGPVCPDGKAMRLVPQPLHKVKHRIVMSQSKGAFAHTVEFFFARVPVNTLGNAHHRDILDPMFAHDLRHRRHLPCPAIDQQQIGPHAFLPVGVFAQQPFEPAVQNLFHHPKVIAGRQIIPFDVEFTIAVFHEPFGARDDHTAHRVGALDMRVVIDLDPFRCFGQVKGLRQALEQFGLRRTLRHFPRKAFACIAQGTVDQLRLFAALGHK